MCQRLSKEPTGQSLMIALAPVADMPSVRDDLMQVAKKEIARLNTSYKYKFMATTKKRNTKAAKFRTKRNTKLGQ